jgi:phosphate starvation-inducible PhoH-like protein
MKTVTFELKDDEMFLLSGKGEENLRMIEESFGTRIVARGNVISMMGDMDCLEPASKAIESMISFVRDGRLLHPSDVKNIIKIVKENGNISEIYSDVILVSPKKKVIRPRTPGQKRYVECIRKNDIVFGIGPAGTGKTYLAVAMAVSSLLRREVDRIILVRPAVEAGEKLGFLPGDLQEKVDPYLRPLYDALHDMLESDRIKRYMENGTIEVAPLAYMRGRTLNDSFIILDEAQNTTGDQMKMFLTRLGFDSKTVVTGDITQIDLPDPKSSGLVQVQNILKGIPGIEFVYFSGEDVVRHELVQEIIKAYEIYESSRRERR